MKQNKENEFSFLKLFHLFSIEKNLIWKYPLDIVLDSRILKLIRSAGHSRREVSLFAYQLLVP